MNCGCSETRARTQAMICSKTSLSPRPVVSFRVAEADRCVRESLSPPGAHRGHGRFLAERSGASVTFYFSLLLRRLMSDP